MKVFCINEVNFGSTGRIMEQIVKAAGVEYRLGVAESRSNRKRVQANQVFIGNRLTRNLGLKLGTLTGCHGLFHWSATGKLLRQIRVFQPDIVHLYNLHGDYINLPMLFHFLKKQNVPVVWTLHDCWAFTGQCAYFTAAGCQKWREGCYKCPQYRGGYPSSTVDNTRLMWKWKKKWFTGVKDLTIVTPSHWLGELVKASYLKEYPVQVIHNGIDLNHFHPTEGDFRRKHGISEQAFVLLGVTFGWEERKGLDVFLELSRRLEQDAFRIVLVGTDENVDRLLPEQIVSIHKTADQKELAEIYSAADLFVNPTREDNYPTVNMEAIACGTPVLIFCTGGSPESVGERTGRVVPCEDVDTMEREIRRICQERPYRKEECAMEGQAFDMQRCFRGYAEVYETVTRENRDC